MSRLPLRPEQARVLMVDDNAAHRLIVTGLLESAGVPGENILEAAGDPRDLLRELAPDRVDLIFLDLQLPGKDGYSVLADLRADAELRDVCVVALTANVRDRERALAAGFDGFLGKPIDGPRFPAILARILGGQRVVEIV